MVEMTFIEPSLNSNFIVSVPINHSKRQFIVMIYCNWGIENRNANLPLVIAVFKITYYKVELFLKSQINQ